MIIKKIHLIFLLIVLTRTLIAQDYAVVDQKVKNYPASFSSPEKLAKQVMDDFEKPEERVRAIYTWIALHIEYDVKLFKSGQKPTAYSYKTEEEKKQKELEILEDLAKTTLKKKRGVCEGYSTLFKVLCNQVSVECEIVHGFAKTSEQEIGSKRKSSNHAWNAIKLNNQWMLVDVTWAAGYVNWANDTFVPGFSGCYFFMSPDKFIMNHWPDEEKWLLTKMTFEEFAALPLYYSSFFENRFEIIEPSEGIIKPSRKDIVRVVLKNPGHLPVKAGLTNEKYLLDIKPEIKNEEEIFEFEYTKKSDTYLSLYYNNQSIITYKITRK
jgi:transglutaminase/protease-like cytokinesis protein 3